MIPELTASGFSQSRCKRGLSWARSLGMGRRGWNVRLLTTAMCMFFGAIAFAASEDKFVSISLERTACYGPCPIYIVTLLAHGSVMFDGHGYLKRKGVSKKKIPQANLTPLLKKIDAIHFWELEDSYFSKTNSNGIVTMITCQPTQFVTVKSTTKTKKIRDYYGGPEGLTELENLIDQVGGVTEWVGKPDDRTR